MYGIVAGELDRDRPASGPRHGREAEAGHRADAGRDRRPLRAAAVDLAACSSRRSPGGAARSSSPTRCAAARRSDGLYGVVSRATRHDAGDKLGYLRANLAYALKRPDLAAKLRPYLRELVNK